MAWTVDQLQALEAAIAQGAMRVKYADHEVQYRSLDEMLRLRDMMRRDLGLSDTSRDSMYPTFSKGLG